MMGITWLTPKEKRDSELVVCAAARENKHISTRSPLHVSVTQWCSLFYFCLARFLTVRYAARRQEAISCFSSGV